MRSFCKKYTSKVEVRCLTKPILREDFCGTFAICCEWAKSGATFEAHGVDLDPEPLQYGKERYF